MFVIHQRSPICIKLCKCVKTYTVCSRNIDSNKYNKNLQIFNRYNEEYYCTAHLEKNGSLQNVLVIYYL